jgi:hypothetical protein
MDSILLLIVIAPVMMILGFVVGRWRDPIWKCKFKRTYLKQDCGILAIVSKDAKNIRKIVVNFNDDMINVGGNIWVLQDKKVYRQNHSEKGFVIKDGQPAVVPLKWEEGVPTIYVNQDTYKPLDFFASEETAKPQSVSAVLLSWVNNQIAKGMNLFKQHQLLLYAVILISILGLGMSYMAYKEITDLKDALATGKIAAPAPAQIPAGGKVEGGTIVITQPETTK